MYTMLNSNCLFNIFTATSCLKRVACRLNRHWQQAIYRTIDSNIDRAIRYDDCFSVIHYGSRYWSNHVVNLPRDICMLIELTKMFPFDVTYLLIEFCISDDTYRVDTIMKHIATGSIQAQVYVETVLMGILGDCSYEMINRFQAAGTFYGALDVFPDLGWKHGFDVLCKLRRDDILDIIIPISDISESDVSRVLPYLSRKHSKIINVLKKHGLLDAMELD